MISVKKSFFVTLFAASVIGAVQAQDSKNVMPVTMQSQVFNQGDKAVAVKVQYTNAAGMVKEAVLTGKQFKQMGVVPIRLTITNNGDQPVRVWFDALSAKEQPHLVVTPLYDGVPASLKARLLSAVAGMVLGFSCGKAFESDLHQFLISFLVSGSATFLGINIARGFTMQDRAQAAQRYAAGFGKLTDATPLNEKMLRLLSDDAALYLKLAKEVYSRSLFLDSPLIQPGQTVERYLFVARNGGPRPIFFAAITEQGEKVGFHQCNVPVMV